MVPVICNPSTGQSLPLPKVKTSRAEVKSFFGYDPIEKQFKVLAMTLPSKGRHRVYEEHQVLTLGAGNLSWRMIDCSIRHDYSHEAICINGGLYYQAEVHHLPGISFTIVCFDVRSEKFSVIKKDQGMLSWHHSTLVNYKGKLGAVEDFDDRFPGFMGDRCFEFWVLEDAESHKWLKHSYLLPPLWDTLVAGDELLCVGVTGTDEVVCRRNIRQALSMLSTIISTGKL